MQLAVVLARKSARARDTLVLVDLAVFGGQVTLGLYCRLDKLVFGWLAYEI